MTSTSANSPSLWFPEAQRARMEQSIGLIVRNELSVHAYSRDLSIDDPRGQIEVLEKLLSVINTYRNRLAPINCLPQDIMGHILSIVLKLESIEDLEWPVDSPDAFGIVDQRGRLRLVSRSWNSFIVSTPSFWSILAPGSVSSKGVERAQQRELSFVHRFGSFDIQSAERLAMTLSPFVPRIRTLRLRDQKLAGAFLRIPFPTLRTLDIGPRDSNNPWPVITQDQFPRLHTLRLIDCPPISSRTPLDTIRIIHLNQAPHGFDETLGFLQGCPNLEELKISPSVRPSWTVSQTSTTVQLHNLQRLEMRIFDPSTLPCLFQKTRIPNINRIVIWFVNIRLLMNPADVGTALQESLDTLQLSGSGSRIVELLISSSAVSCVTADGLSITVKMAHENGCRELAGYLLDRLDPKMLCVTIHFQDQGESSWVDQMLGQRNVVELRARGGTLDSTRALVDCLALFDKETVAEEAEEVEEAEEAEEGPDLELSTNVTLPWHSLQTLIFEAVEVDLPQLLRMATSRVNNLQDVPSQLQRVTLINCDTGNSPNLSSTFRAVGVDLQLR